MLQRRWPQSEEAEVHPVPGVEELVVEAEAKGGAQPHLNKNHWEKSILIFLQGSGKGAVCTENGGGGHISVLSPPHAHGRTSSHQNLQTNETETNPEIQ